MPNILRINKPIPIPSGAATDNSGHRVFYPVKKNGKVVHRPMIGKLAQNGTMYPNSTNFPKYYPDLWRQLTGDRPPPHLIKMGRFMATLGVVIKNGLYKLAVDALGAKEANAYMDYAMFSFGERTSATYLYEDTMCEQFLFSGKLYSDSWFSKFFKDSSSAAQHQVKLKWLEERKALGHDEVVLCIDGSNNDCDVKDSELAEPGEAKSHTKKNVVGYMFAVDASDGCPITWDVNPGGMHDVKAIYRILTRLKNSGLKVKCIVIDRGFGSQGLLNTLKRLEIDHVLMLKAEANGHRVLMQKHAQELARRNVNQLVDENGIFGLTDSAKVFAGSKEEECIGLFFDSINAPRRAMKLAKDVFLHKTELEERIAAGDTDVQVLSAYQKYLQIAKTTSGIKVEFKQELQDAMDKKGFFSIASSKIQSARCINVTYDLRDCSEKQYSILKSHQGGDATNVHDDKRIRSKFFGLSLGSIIRNDIERVCKKLGFKTEVIIQCLDRCQMELQGNGTYDFVNDIQNDLLAVFKELGIKPEHFDFVVEQYNKERAGGVPNDIKALPETVAPPPPKKRGRKPKPKPPVDPNKPKRGRGRPPGRLNNKTLARMAREAANPLPPLPKRGRGRPPGRLNNKTLRRLERERRASEPKKPVGRPPGRKNNKTLEREALLKQMKEKEQATKATQAPAPTQPPAEKAENGTSMEPPQEHETARHNQPREASSETKQTEVTTPPTKESKPANTKGTATPKKRRKSQAEEGKPGATSKKKTRSTGTRQKKSSKKVQSPG